jgi:exopolysaccharide biosynthesis polyprenyl glycosylphosphotransferase
MIAAAPKYASRAAAAVPGLRRWNHPMRAMTEVEGGACLGGGDAGRPQSFALKRCFDVVFSSLVLLALAPLFALIALAVRWSSPGPVFFRQQRVGRNGELFWMLKFRTMRVAAPEECDTRWTTAGDPRRTRVGAFLRHTSLDELPQFFNVLKGEMSVVGPRPERPYFARRFLREVEGYERRFWLPAGITGWAQVNGWRGDTSIERRVEHDLYYLRHRSFSFDLWIIARTLWSGLIDRNAY